MNAIATPLFLPPDGNFVLTFDADTPLSDDMRAMLAEQITLAMRTNKPLVLAPEMAMSVTPFLPRSLSVLTFPA